MIRIRFLNRVAVSAVLIAFTAAGSLRGCHSRRISDEEYKSLIDKELPLGSTVEDVDAFLHAHVIENFGYTEGLEPVFAPTERKPFPEKRKFVWGRIKNVESSFAVRFDMYLIFYFDDDKKLMEYEIKRVGTGL